MTNTHGIHDFWKMVAQLIQESDRDLHRILIPTVYTCPTQCHGIMGYRGIHAGYRDTDRDTDRDTGDTDRDTDRDTDVYSRGVPVGYRGIQGYNRHPSD